MNISETFIRRPIATSLMMLGSWCSALATYNLLPVAALPRRRFPDHHRVGDQLPGASPETMASSVATPLEQQFAAHPGPRRDELDQRRSARPRSRCSSISAATSTARRPTCRRPSMRRAACCPRTCPTRRPTARSTRPTAPILIYAVSLRRAADLPRSTTTPTRSWRRRSRQVTGVVAGAGRPASRTSPCACRPIPAALAARGIALEDVRTAIGQRHRQPAQGQSRADAHQSITIDTNDQLFHAAGYRATSSSPIATARRSSCSDIGQRRSTARKAPAHRRLVQRQARRAAPGLPASPAPTPSRWSTASRR